MKVFVKISSILSINILLFLLLGILIEGVFRVVGIPYKVKYVPNENAFARFDTELGWSYIPNKSSIQKTENITTPVYFDKNGFRVPRPDTQLDSFKPSVLFIGDSFTFGHGLSYEESFVGKFDALIGSQYQIVNLGVQGYGSDQTLLALKKYLNKFNAKVVIYTFIEDHILRNGSYDRRMLVPTAKFLGTKPQFALTGDNKLYLARKPLLYKDYIHSYLIDLLKMRGGKLMGSFPPYPEDLTKAIIQEMKRYSNEHGARFIVLNWRWTDHDYDRLFRGLDVDTIDTMKDAPDGWGKMVLLGGIHPNAQAGDHADRILLDYFREKGLFPINAAK